jgi:hypothetical protein
VDLKTERFPMLKIALLLLVFVVVAGVTLAIKRIGRLMLANLSNILLGTLAERGIVTSSTEDKYNG